MDDLQEQHLHVGVGISYRGRETLYQSVFEVKAGK